MSFGLVPSLPFVAGTSTFTAAVANAWRSNLANAVDGSAGGQYNLLTGMTLDFPAGGGNITIEAPFSATDIVTANVFGTMLIESGATFQTLVGATVDFNSTVTFSGDTVFTGPTNVVQAGEWEFFVDAYQLAGSTFHVGASTMAPGHLVIDGRGPNASGSDVTLLGNAELHLETGTSLVTDSSSTATMNGSTTISNMVSATQTGLFTKSGAGARTNLRIGRPASPDSDQSLDPTQWDVITLNNLVSFTTGRNWTLDNPSFSGGQTALFYVVGDAVHNLAASGPVVIFKDTNGTTIGTFNDTSAGPGGILFYWEDAGGYSVWRALLKWGSAT